MTKAAPASLPLEPMQDAALNQQDAFMANVAGAGAGGEVRVHRKDAQGNWCSLHKYNAEEFDPMVIGQRYGGGVYRLQLVGLDSRGSKLIRKTVEWAVDESIQPDNGNGGQAPPPPPALAAGAAPEGFGARLDKLTELVTAMAARSNEVPREDRLLTALIGAMRPPDTLGIIAALKALIPAPPAAPQRTPLEETVAAMDLIDQIASRRGDSGGGGTNWPEMILAGIEALKHLPAPPAPPPPNAGAVGGPGPGATRPVAGPTAAENRMRLPPPSPSANGKAANKPGAGADAQALDYRRSLIALAELVKAGARRYAVDPESILDYVAPLDDLLECSGVKVDELLQAPNHVILDQFIAIESKLGPFREWMTALLNLIRADHAPDEAEVADDDEASIAGAIHGDSAPSTDNGQPSE